MITVKFLRPQAGFAAGAIWHTDKLGVANTLISFGACVKVEDHDDKLDAKEDVGNIEPASDSSGSKVAPKAKRKRSNSRRKSDTAS